MGKSGRMMSDQLIQNYLTWLREQERSGATIQKYRHNLTSLTLWLDKMPLTKADWKQHLVSSQAPATVNSMLVSANGIFRYMGWKELSVKPLKIQRNMFLEENKELTKTEYVRLVRAAEKRGNRRLMLLLQTICATGIRVSELWFITVEALSKGRAVISNNGKCRLVFLRKKLKKLLKSYVKEQKITAGAVFVTRSGKPLNRCNIWREMKSLFLFAGLLGKSIQKVLRPLTVGALCENQF